MFCVIIRVYEVFMLIVLYDYWTETHVKTVYKIFFGSNDNH